jgi:hypothetical protein
MLAIARSGPLPSGIRSRRCGLDVTGFAQPLLKCQQEEAISLRPCAVEESNHRYRWLLRACRERPRGRRTAEKRDEIAPSHGRPQGQWITDNYSRVRAVHRSKSGRTITAPGHTRSFRDVCSMSALVHFTDSSRTSPEVREVPIASQRTAAKKAPLFDHLVGAQEIKTPEYSGQELSRCSR